MKIRSWGWIAALLCVVATPASATIDYTVSLAQPERHIFHVTMTVPDAGESLTVQMPAWNALYQIRDFAHRVQTVRGHSKADPSLAITKLDKQTWRLSSGKTNREPLGSVTLEYGIYWDEVGPFATQLDSTHAFINFAMILMYVPDRRGEDVRVQFAEVPSSWNVAIALPNAGNSSTFRAATYDALVDAPAEIGSFVEERFTGNGAKIRVVIHGTDTGRAALRDAIQRMVSYQTQLMQEAPFEEFLFLYHFGVGGGGGMEHANSTAISAGSSETSLEVTAHEIFHLWNVKRLRPRSLEPLCPNCRVPGRGVDHTQENFTRALWFAEGVTSTYGSFTMVRTNLWSPEQFYRHVASEISNLESRPARLWQSAEQSSLDTWFDRYGYYGRGEASISYYNKGQILGYLLDLQIRDATNNQRSLDDVMRLLNAEFARKGRFYDDSADIRAAVEKVAGRSFQDFFRRFVAGTDELPCAQALALAGLELYSQDAERPDLGFSATRRQGERVVDDLRPGTPAQAAGLRAGDVLVDLDGGPFPANVGRWLREKQPGQTVRLRVRRNGEERDFVFALTSRGDRVYGIREVPEASERQLRIRNGILRGTTDGRARGADGTPE